MPTAKQIDLFQQCDGGSGDAREDALVVRNLGNILDIPEPQVVSYIRTRDRKSVIKLKKVLQEMPRTDWKTSPTATKDAAWGAGGRTPSQRGQSQPSRPRSSAEAQVSRQNAQARLQSMGVLTTEYGDCLGALGPGPKSKTRAIAFDGDSIIRKGYRQAFDQWKDQATEGEVRVLAETCRSLRFFNAPERAPTSYHETFCGFPGHTAHLPPAKTNARNVSAVPLGSIYAPSEKEALMERQEAHEQNLAAATKRQADWRGGTAISVAPGRLAVYGEPPTATLKKNLTSDNRVYKSSSRESWNNDVHSKMAIAKHGHSQVVTGAATWSMAGCTGHQIAETIFALRDPKHFPEGGSPNRQRIVHSKMARNEETSRLSASMPSL